MLKNYLVTAFRNMRKNKTLTLINVLGLSTGMAVCLLILYYVHFEKSYDRFHERQDRIFRLRYEREDKGGDAVRFASCCPPAALRVRSKMPEAEKVARMVRYTAVISYGAEKYIEDKIFFAEPDFADIFSFRFLSGNPVNDLKKPNQAFISSSMAKKYFGDEDPEGKTISLDGKMNFTVAGVFEDVPQNSHVKFNFLMSFQNILKIYGEDFDESWGDSGAFTYLLLKEGVDASEFERKLNALAEAEVGEMFRQYNLTMFLKMQPLPDIHLTSHFQQEYEPNGDRDTVNYLFIIAFFIIIIAWVNYINLSTARSLTRAREVGLRKVIGASRRQLTGQFLFEILLTNLIAVLLTFALLFLSLPLFGQITGIPADHPIWMRAWFWAAVSLMFFAGVFLSGAYPVFVLTSFKPIGVLKGKLGNAAGGMNLRKGLVVFQFVMATGLIICTLAVYQQLSFMKNMDLGFNRDQILVVKAPRVRDSTFVSKLEVFKHELRKNAGIESFCVVTEVPGRQIYWDAGAIHRVGSDEEKNYQIVGIDYDFVNVFGLAFAAGRNFSMEFPSDKQALILNETACEWLGFKGPEDAIGKQVSYWGEIFSVIGVLKNFHQQSPKAAFEPHIYRFLPQGRGVRGHFAMKVGSDKLKAVLGTVQEQYNRFFPGNPFDFFFLDEYFNQQYKADELFGKVFGLFSFLAVFITSLGIFGLSSFMTIQRTKEIGIRKVLGAGMTRILLLLTRDFLLLIFTAFIIAIPISYYTMNLWLDSFASRMEMTAGLFLFPLIMVGSITLLTIGAHVIKAAAANPVESLRYE